MPKVEISSKEETTYREPLKGHKLVIAVVAPSHDSFSVMMPIVPSRESLGLMIEAIIACWNDSTGEKFEQ